MANIARTPKCGNDWTPNDLLAYNIRVIYQDSATFFGVPELPQPDVDDEVLTAQDASAMQRDDSYALLRAMELVMASAHGQESAVVDFVVEPLRTLRYTGRESGRVVRTRKDIRLWICGKERRAKTSVCIVDEMPDIGHSS